MTRIPGLIIVVALVCAPGCGSRSDVRMPDYGSEEGLKIAQAVSEFNDSKGDSAKFKKSFVEAPPATWKQYDKYVFQVAIGSPKVDGDSATATVTVHNESNNEVVTTKEWSFVKVGGVWKIKAAPIA